MIPQLIKDGNVFVEGRGFAGKFKEMKLPKLTIKTEEINAGGMVGPIEVDMGLEKLEASVTLYEWNDDVIKRFGIANHSGVAFRFTFAAERDDASEELTPVEAVLRGRIKEMEPDGYKQGEAPSFSIQIAVSYYRYEHGGESLIEIDMPRYVYKVGGVDRYAARRAALGIN